MHLHVVQGFRHRHFSRAVTFSATGSALVCSNSLHMIYSPECAICIRDSATTPILFLLVLSVWGEWLGTVREQEKCAIFSFDRQAAGSIFRHCLFSNPSELLLTHKAMVILASFGAVALGACERLKQSGPRSEGGTGLALERNSSVLSSKGRESDFCFCHSEP